MNEEQEIRKKKKRRRRRNPVPLVILSILLVLSLSFSALLFVQNGDLKKSNDAYKNNNMHLSEEIGKFKAGVAEGLNKITELEDKLQAFSDENETHLKEIDDLKKEIEKLQSSSGKNPDDSAKLAYLTFDDGVSSNTPKILAILKEYNIKATFFPNWQSGNEKLYKQIIDEGHEIGNHTYSHNWSSVYSTVEGFKSEVTRLQEKITEATGGYVPTIFRFPGGSNNTIHRKYNTDIMNQIVNVIGDELNLVYYDWNVDSMDASSTTPLAKEKLVSNVLNYATGKRAIVLMHDTAAKPTTVEALPEIIEGLIKKGYTFDVITADVAPIHFKKPS